MLKKFLLMSANKWYWLGLLFLGVGFEATALFYQYVLDYLPCVLCIHARIWVLGIIIVSLLALQFYKSSNGLLVLQVLMTLLAVGLFERSYQLLGTERGFLFGDCNMEAGLPTWFALDDWFPSVFKVWEACGYTPELLLGVTMAEALIVISAVLFIVNSFLTISLLVQRYLNRNTATKSF